MQSASHHVFYYISVYVINWFIGMYKYYKELGLLFEEQAKYIFMGFLVLFSIGPLAYLPATELEFILLRLFRVYLQSLCVCNSSPPPHGHQARNRKWAVYTSSFLSVIIPAFFIEYGLSDLFGCSFITISS